MINKEKIETLEKEIAKTRFDLMLKGSELYTRKQNISNANIEEIYSLTNEVSELRQRLFDLNKKMGRLKYSYYVVYEVRFINIWTQQVEKETYSETLLLNADLQIELIENNNWQLNKKEIYEFLLELSTLLKRKYEEVTLLYVKRVN